MIGQLPPPPRRTKSSPEPQALASTPPRDMDAVKTENAALSTELATVQGRLQDALDVLEGVLAERSALLKQTHELQGQLAAALAQQHGGSADAECSSAPGVPEAGQEEQAGATPPRVLRQELLLAQAQLTQLRQAQRAWEAERQALLSDVEEERARLQEGLSQALMQASCAQREADVAAERAAHWCSLADLLQQSALLPDGPASPEGSAAASLSATPASRMAGTPASRAPTSVLSSSSAPRSLGRMRGSDAARSAAHLLAEWRPASALRQPTRPAAANSHSSVASRGGSPQGPGLLKAFQAVAEERAPSSLEPAEPVAVVQPAEVAAPSAGVCSSADVYATKLRLKRLDTSPPSTGSAGHGPLTPMQHMTLPGAAAATPATAASGSSARSTTAGTPAAGQPRSSGRRGLLSRMASLTACGAGLERRIT